MCSHFCDRPRRKRKDGKAKSKDVTPNQEVMEEKQQSRRADGPGKLKTRKPEMQLQFESSSKDVKSAIRKK
jgi:hypothetical protein